MTRLDMYFIAFPPRKVLRHGLQIYLGRCVAFAHGPRQIHDLCPRLPQRCFSRGMGLGRIDQDLARRIYIGCRSKPEDLEHYIQNEKPLSRLLPAVLGAFSAKCALCTCDANRRSEIRQAFKAAEGTMFPMPELEGWFKTIEDNVRSCPTRHSRFEIWPLLRMLRVKVEEPKVAKIETQYYD